MVSMYVSLFQNCFDFSSDMSFPAHVAAYSGDLSHLRMLIENRVVNIDEKDDKGSTPLHKGISCCFSLAHTGDNVFKQLNF